MTESEPRELSTRVERIFVKPDGTEVRIVAEIMFGRGLHPSTEYNVWTRVPNTDNWHLCSKDSIRGIKAPDAIRYGHTEALQAATPAEVKKTMSLLGKPIEEINHAVEL